MKVLCAILLLMATSGLVIAVDSMEEEPINIISGQQVEPPRDILFCQPPTAGYYTMNASTGYASELADDFPEEFGVGQWMVDEIVVYIGEWGDDWVNPAGIIVNLYSGDCPPDMAPYQTLYFPGGDPAFMDFFFVNDQPGSYDLEVTLYVNPNFQILSPMSIGFVVDNTWGEGAPYCGVDYTVDDDIYGCGEAYIDHAYWEHPRWTPASASHGAPVDIAYCLGANGATAAGTSTWSVFKTLY